MCIIYYACTCIICSKLHCNKIRFSRLHMENEYCTTVCLTPASKKKNSADVPPRTQSPSSSKLLSSERGMNPSCFSSRILDIGMLSSSLKHHIILVKVRLAFELHSCPLFRHCGLRAQRTGSSVFATGCSATSPGPRWRFFYPAGPKPPTPTGGFFYSGPFFVSPGAPQLVRRLAEWQR